MKKLIACVVGAMMVVSLAACSPTKVEPGQRAGAAESGESSTEDVIGKEIAQQETHTDMKSLKEFDPNLPTMEAITLYYEKDNGTGLRRKMLDVEVADAETLVEKLVEYGVLEDGVKVNDFQIEGGTAVGPGVSASEVEDGDRIGTLDLSQLGPFEGDSEKFALYAIANSFGDSFLLDKMVILVDGEEYSSSLITDGYLYPVENYEKLN